VIGIVASRIVERYHRPVLVLSRDPDTGLATGSARGISAFHWLQALESMPELFERFGGHRHAAGCTLSSDRVPELRRRLLEHGAKVLRSDDFVPTLTLDADLSFREIHERTMEQLTRLAPFGAGNPSPQFATAGVRLAGAPRILKEKHVKLLVEHDQAVLSAVGWRLAARAEGLNPGALLDTAFSIEPDDYNGGWQLILRDFRLSAGMDTPAVSA
jgi:single-stranded-DNA-specific exonuclease